MAKLFKQQTLRYLLTILDDFLRVNSLLFSLIKLFVMFLGR